MPKRRDLGGWAAACRFAGSAVVLAFTLLGCARTFIQPVDRVSPSKLPAPDRILVNSFNVDPAVVTEYQGILRQQPANPNPIARQSEIARAVSEILTAELVHGLRRKGLRVESTANSNPVDDNDLVIEGRFLKIDEGSPLRRWLIGFGSGASRIETRIAGYRGKGRHKIIEFATRADSGKLPGAVATVPAAAVAPSGLATGITIGSAAASAANGAPSQIGAMAAASAQQAARFLAQFFAEQGWLENHRAKKPPSRLD
jgi:hypothetical protein